MSSFYSFSSLGHARQFSTKTVELKLPKEGPWTCVAKATNAMSWTLAITEFVTPFTNSVIRWMIRNKEARVGHGLGVMGVKTK